MTQKSFALRLDDDLKNLIEIQAKFNGRSINSEILARLNASFDKEELELNDKVDDILKYVKLLVFYLDRNSPPNK